MNKYKPHINFRERLLFIWHLACVPYVLVLVLSMFLFIGLRMLWEQITGKHRLVKLASMAVVMLCAVGAQAAGLMPTNPPPQVRLAWDPVTDQVGVSNYNVYWGVGSRTYTNVNASGGSTNWTVTLPARGVTYYFAVTTVDANGLESDFSTEVSYTVAPLPTAPNLHPLIILHVQVAPTPTSQFADSGIDWSLGEDMQSQYFKLRLENPNAQVAAVPTIRIATPKIKRELPLPPVHQAQ
jgi:hypothetical protein